MYFVAKHIPELDGLGTEERRHLVSVGERHAKESRRAIVIFFVCFIPFYVTLAYIVLTLRAALLDNGAEITPASVLISGLSVLCALLVGFGASQAGIVHLVIRPEVRRERLRMNKDRNAEGLSGSNE